MGKHLPHDIPPESVKEGDTITVSWRVGSIKHTRTGPVGRILFEHGKRSRSFVTPEGDEIVHWIPGSRVVFTLIGEKPVLGVPLAGLEYT